MGVAGDQFEFALLDVPEVGEVEVALGVLKVAEVTEQFDPVSLVERQLRLLFGQ